MAKGAAIAGFFCSINPGGHEQLRMGMTVRSQLKLALKLCEGSAYAELHANLGDTVVDSNCVVRIFG